MGESKGGVARYRSSAIQDLCDTIRWDIDPSRKFSCAHTEYLQLFRQMFSRMNRTNRHNSLLMVIDDFYVRWPRRPTRPLKADSPLVIDANAVLALAVTLQGFEPVTGQRTKIFDFDSCFQAVELQPGSALNSRERFDSLTGGKIFGPLVPVADNHSQSVSGRYALRQA